MVLTDGEIDAGARALREHDMAGRITRDWSALPNSDKRKWREKSVIVLGAVESYRDVHRSVRTHAGVV